MSTWTYWGTPVFGRASSTCSVVAELAKRAERIGCCNAQRFTDGLRRTANPLLSNAAVLLNARVDELRAHPPDFTIHDCIALRAAEAARLRSNPQQEKGRQALA